MESLYIFYFINIYYYQIKTIRMIETFNYNNFKIFL